MPDGKEPLPWLVLPNELKIRVMRQLVSPSVSFTDYDSRPGQLTRRADNEPWASRQALAVTCLASRQLDAICRPILYETVALKDYREILCLLRSLVRNPRLHTWVRRFVWIDINRGADALRSIAETGLDVHGLVAEITAFRHSTGDEINLVEIFQLHTTDSRTAFLRKALGVVLAMLPRIQTLFITTGSFPFDFLGLNQAPGPHPVTQLLSSTLPSLGMLEEITVDLSNSPWTLWYLILNCPHLRRVQLKGPISFGATLDRRVVQAYNPNAAIMDFHTPPQGSSLPRAVGDKVQEFVIYKSQQARWAVLPKIFPNLERLVAVFGDDAWRRQFWTELPPLPGLQAMETVVNELGQNITLYKQSLRSLTVTGFLSDHYLTPPGGYRDTAGKGHRWLVAPIPPLLSPGLSQVPLVELTTDCVWLFGRADSPSASQISSLLPSALVSFHLIDYWGVHVDEEVILDGEPQVYYPASPSGLTPLDFLDNVFAILHDSCATQYTQLKHITLSSPMFDEDGRWSTPATRPVVRNEVQAWQARTCETFARIGIKFSFTTMRDLEISIKSSWGRM